MTDDIKLEKIIGKISRLPSLPDNIQKINRMIDSHNSTMDAIGRAIAGDQTLSAQVLKLVNSGFYGFANTVSSITQAVVLLGLNVVRSLISTAWASSMIAKSFPGLYEHSLACSRTCFLLSKKLGIDEPEEVSTIGLLHDIGKVVLAEYLPEEFASVQSMVKDQRMRFCDAERTVMGVAHSDIGKLLLEKWNLPPTAISPIADHHGFQISSEYAKRTAIIILADVMVRAEGFGWGGDNVMPELSNEVTNILQLQPKDLRPLMDEAVDQIHDIPRYNGDRK
jgi:putative nucleotidyltransferase with HDIG domain